MSVAWPSIARCRGQPESCSTPIERVVNCSDAEVQGGCGNIFSHVREAFVGEVVMFGEQGAKKGEMPVGNWHADLNKIMARDAHAWVV